MILLATIFILGACIGSFLNVCIYRLPRDLSIIRPRSFCPRCSKKILWFDNIPMVSFLILRGRCRFCRKKISIRYLLVELLTALITLLVCVQGWFTPLGIFEIVTQLALSYALIVISVIDLEFYVIPNEITYSYFILAMLLALISPYRLAVPHAWDALLRALLGALVGGGSLWTIGWVAKLFMKKEAMGLGDVKLMMVIGAWLGWKAALGSIMIASVIGSMVGLVLIIMRKVQLESRIPFGPFLSIGILIFMLWGKFILSWYLKMFSGLGPL